MAAMGVDRHVLVVKIELGVQAGKVQVYIVKTAYGTYIFQKPVKI